MIICLSLFTAASPQGELLLQTGHSSTITHVAFAHTRNALVSAGAERRLLFWDPASGLAEQVYVDPTKAAALLAWSGDDKLLALGNLDGEVKVLSLPGLATVARLVPSKKGEWVKGLAFAGGRLIASTWAGVYAYDTTRWQKLPLPPEVGNEEGYATAHERTQRVFLSRHNGSYFNSSTSSSAFGRASAVELDANTLGVARWYVAPQSTARVAVSPSGEYLAGVATGSMLDHPKQIYVWSTKTGQLARTYDFGRDPTVAIGGLEWVDDRTLLAGLGKTLLWLDRERAEPTRSFPFPANITGVAIDRQGATAAVNTADDLNVTLVDTAAGEVASVLRQRVRVPESLLDPKRPPHELVVGYGDRMRVWDLAAGKVSPGFVRVDNAWDASAHASDPRVAVLQSAGPRGSSANEIWLTDALGEHSERKSLATDARAFTLDKRRARGFSSGGAGLCRVEITGDQAKTSQCSADILKLGGADVLALSPDETRLAVGASYGKVLLYDARTKQRRAQSAQMPHAPVRGLEFSPDGKQLVAASMGGDVWLLDASTLRHKVLVQQTREYSDTYRFAHAFSPDGKWLAVSGDSTEVLVHALGVDAPPRRFVAGAGGVASLAFSSDARFIVTGTIDGALRLWRADDLSLVASLIAVDLADFVIVTPDNYYMASRGALDAVAFKQGGVAFAFEQFDALLNRPDIVLERLGYAAKPTIDMLRAAARRRMGRLGVRADASSVALFDGIPEVRVDADQGAVVSAPGVRLRVSASAKASLAALRIWVNDVPLGVAAGRPLSGASFTGEVDVPLSTGRNRIQVSVTDARGVESKRATLSLRKTGERKSTTFYVGMGVSRYADHAYDLTYAAKDAENLGDIFGAGGGKRLLLVDEQVTRDALARAREFLSAAGEDDLVVVFVAGHGLVSDALDYYFATHDVSFTQPETRGLSYEALEGLFDGLRARQRLLLMDTCHSGEIDKPEVALSAADAALPAGFRARAMAARGVKAKITASGNLEALLAQLFSDVRKGVGAVVVSSAAGTEFAIESSELRNGVFTYAWKEALTQSKADKNGDRAVQVSEAREYVFARVRALTSGQQTPTMRRDLIDHDFVLAR